MREIWFVLLLALGLAGAGPAIAQAPAPAAKVDAAKAASLLAVTKDDRVLGQPNAPITIIEYASLSCPHCAHFENEVLPEIQKQWIDTGKAKLVMRDFPLDREALAAEVLARCMPADRFYPLVKAMFADQPEWVPVPDWRNGLQRIAKFAGIGSDQFNACLANKALENEVAASRLVASQQLGVDATPTFFINGKKFEGAPTAEAFNKALAAAAPKS
jgi:protein-disulfide isomerase